MYQPRVGKLKDATLKNAFDCLEEADASLEPFVLVSRPSRKPIHRNGTIVHN